MSIWTQIVATFDIDTYRDIDNIKEHVEEQLKKAPKITGSEQNAEIFVNVLSGYNSSIIGGDCQRCDYGKTIKYSDNGDCTCDADENYKCPDGQYQTRVLISIIGDLRDKGKDKTKKEYKEFYKYLTKTLGYGCKNKSVSIIGY